MAAAKGFAALAASLVLCGAALGQETAAVLLSKSMQRCFPANIIAVILQKDPRSDSFQRVKVERNKLGMARCTILAPLRWSGMASVDTGERLLTYLPDKRIILDQESPGTQSDEVDERIALAKRNYHLRIIPSGPVAGRQTICIEAKPKDDDLEVRRYTLDAQTAYPLRLETQEGNEITMMFDTKDISFPKSLDPKLFTLEPSGDVYVQKFNKPKRVLSGTQAKNLVGFVPLVPNGLPLGFKVQELQFSEDGAWKSIVVRMSDGLAKATLYQWPSSANVQVQSYSNSSIMVDKATGLKLMIVSDLSPAVRLQLLKAFIAEASIDPAVRAQRLFGMLVPLDASLQASLELITSVWAFSGIDSLNGSHDFDSVQVTRTLPPNP